MIDAWDSYANNFSSLQAVDCDSTDDKIVLNCIVSLKEDSAKT
jgi:hypothetical protein